MTDEDIDRPQPSRRAILPALLLPAFLTSHPAAAFLKPPSTGNRDVIRVEEQEEEDDEEDARPQPPLEVPAFDRRRTELLKALLTSDGFRQSLAGQAGAPSASLSTRYAPDAAHARRIHAAYLAIAGRSLSAAERAAIAAAFPGENAFLDNRLGRVSPVSVSGTDLLDQTARWLRVIGALGILAPEGLMRSSFDEAALFTALRRQVALGYATAPVLAGLQEPERRELAVWLLLNWNDMFRTVLDNLGGGAGAAASAPIQALQARCRRMLQELGLDAGRVQISNAGLRNR